jgi:hypothetical protein
MKNIGENPQDKSRGKDPNSCLPMSILGLTISYRIIEKLFEWSSRGASEPKPRGKAVVGHGNLNQ